MSKAQELKKLREKNGNCFTTNDFLIRDKELTLESYYDNLLSLEEIDNATREYGDNIEKVNYEFAKKTKLNKVDLGFLFTATALQCVRQYLFTKFRDRVSDKIAAQNTKGYTKDHSNRSHRYYMPSIEEVLSNPVPFDANIGANGALAGAGKMGHRISAIGHDPILGLVIGTANIATSTLTNYKFQSFHIKSSMVGTGLKDAFGNNADTFLVLQKTFEKLQSDDNKYGRGVVAAALGKEIIHLKSDIGTKNSLPFPIISVMDVSMASSLAKYGIDSANIADFVKQASGAIFINSIISMIHGIYGNVFESNISQENVKLFQVRTRKILLYSNLIATSSNLIYSYLTKNFKCLDLGGLATTVYRLFVDPKFIHKVKVEFLNSTLNKIYEDKIKDIEFYYS